MKEIRSILDKVGPYQVRQVSVQHSSTLVDLTHPRTGCLHTTEGHFDDGLAELTKHYAPHFMVGFNPKIKKSEIIQFVPVGFSARATRANNEKLLVQIEMVGFSDEKPWLPIGKNKQHNHDYGDTLDALCWLFNVCEVEYGIPLSHPWPDGDFGLAGLAPRNKHRNQGKLGHIAGWFCHGDMPNPDIHWDVGNMQWSKVFANCHKLQTGESENVS